MYTLAADFPMGKSLDVYYRMGYNESKETEGRAINNMVVIKIAFDNYRYGVLPGPSSAQIGR